MNWIKPCDVPLPYFLCCRDFARNRNSALVVLSHSADLRAVFYFSHQYITIPHNTFIWICDFFNICKSKKNKWNPTKCVFFQKSRQDVPWKSASHSALSESGFCFCVWIQLFRNGLPVSSERRNIGITWRVFIYTVSMCLKLCP